VLATTAGIYFICSKTESLLAKPNLYRAAGKQNKKGSQPCLVTAEVHPAQHPTPSPINLTEQCASQNVPKVSNPRATLES